MNGSGNDAPFSNGGEFLLSLLQKRQPHTPSPQQSVDRATPTPMTITPPHPQPQQLYLPNDPAVAAVGPTVAFPPRSWLSPPFPQNPWPSPVQDLMRVGLSNTDHAIHNLLHQPQDQLMFGSYQTQIHRENVPNLNSFDNLFHQFDSPTTSISNPNLLPHRNIDTSLQQERRLGKQHYSGNYSSTPAPPPGFPTSATGGRPFDLDKDKANYRELSQRVVTPIVEDAKMHDTSSLGLTRHLVRPSGSNLHSVSASHIEESILALRTEDGGRHWGQEKITRENGQRHGGGDDEMEDFSEELVDHLLDESDNKSDKHDMNEKKHHRNSRDKESRTDNRGKGLLSQRIRNLRWRNECRRDIHRLNGPLLAIYESLIPPEEEKAKQKQLLTLLEKLVCKEWPKARLYLYGSCANSFGVSKSDIDVCLAIDDEDINKSDILLKLADILESDNLQNVQALTRARVPIVKLMDPVTGISCDICINNLLAVVNTKLLRDYAHIDARLRQLAYIVKHWAKSRGVNETYQGTLSSYAYVLMCIHFLQQRRPAILPCLQGMKTTYSVTVNDIECAFFDRVERLHDFGSCNKDTIAQLVWGFFRYWAYGHDYTSSVISVRTGSVISKLEKDWTRRIGNDRHLICIEDPFEISHDLGRVVDKFSIKVLREEFERAADIMQYDPNPCVTLFEPYVPS